MSKYRSIRLVIFIQIFSLTHIQGETSSHIDSPAPKSQREVDSSERRDDWCYGRLTPDEKRKIQEEIATIYSKHQSNKEELQKSLEKVIQNHTGTESDKRSAEVAAMTVDFFKKLNKVSQFSAALSALTKGEKIKDSALSKTAEALKGDFEKLKALGFKFDPEKQKWDLSGVKDVIFTSGDNKELKQAMANLISPDFAEKVGQRDREVKDVLKRFGEEKESFLRASKESNTYANAMTGTLVEWLGYERGLDGKTAPEIEREGAYKGMLAHLKRMKDTLGVEPEAVDDIISSIQDAVSKDSAGLAALDQDLTQKIGALKTTAAVLAVGAVAVTGGLAGPTLLGGVLAGAGTTAASGGLGVAGGIALGLQAIPAAINVAIDTASGKSLSCAAMDELYKRGANAVASTAIAAGTVAGFGAAGSALSPNSSATAGLGAGVVFTGLGAAGAIQNGKDLLQQWKLASEAEARGDKATAAEIRREVLKRGIELGLNVAWLGYGLNGVVRGYKGLKASKETPEPASPAPVAVPTPSTEPPTPRSFTEDMSPSELQRYKEYWGGMHDTTGSAPFGVKRTFTKEGELKTVTTYDQHGRPYRQYGLQEGHPPHEHDFSFPQTSQRGTGVSPIRGEQRPIGKSEGGPSPAPTASKQTRSPEPISQSQNRRTPEDLNDPKNAERLAPQTRSPQSDFKIVAEGPLEDRTYSMINISTGETVQQMKGANIRSGVLNSGEIGDYKGTLSPPPDRAKMFYEAIQKDFEQQGLIRPTTLRSTYVDSNGRAFTRAYKKYLKEGLPRDEAAKRAVLETPSGAAAYKAFGVEPYDVEIKPAFDRAGNPTDWVEIEFRVPRASNSVSK